MPATPVTVERQRKYKFKVSVTTATGTYNVNADGFTPPDRRGDVIARNYVGGQSNLVGPMKYGEGTIKFALQVGVAGGGDLALLIADLEDLISHDQDTCDIVVHQTNRIFAEDADEQNSYTLRMENCRISSTKFDDLDSRGEDDMVNYSIMFVPQYVERLKGDQMPA